MSAYSGQAGLQQVLPRWRLRHRQRRIGCYRRDDLAPIAAAQTYSDHEIVTSEMVLVEFLNGFSDRGPRLRPAAAKAVKTLRSSPSVTVIPQRSV